MARKNVFSHFYCKFFQMYKKKKKKNTEGDDNWALTLIGIFTLPHKRKTLTKNFKGCPFPPSSSGTRLIICQLWVRSIRVHFSLRMIYLKFSKYLGILEDAEDESKLKIQ